MRAVRSSISTLSASLVVTCICPRISVPGYVTGLAGRSVGCHVGGVQWQQHTLFFVHHNTYLFQGFRVCHLGLRAARWDAMWAACIGSSTSSRRKRHSSARDGAAAPYASSAASCTPQHQDHAFTFDSAQSS